MASMKPVSVTATPILSVPPPPSLTHALSPHITRSSPPITPHPLSSSLPSGGECSADLNRCTPRKQRRLFNLVDIRSGVAGSSVELGGVSHPQPPQLGKRQRAPLAHLDSKFVVSQ
ncbi:uncharacterized protein LOC108665965, partial [Hyalella azteca]|uniref:Uncharacterized protein LOC108665965 n=1 Tax=Hyalella azteca TaxID=294128 RepID=A0A8B7N3U7_HYAAZ